ncbi:hypothetical protein FRC11_006899, partial [Ceratobasidium sp. 423]
MEDVQRWEETGTQLEGAMAAFLHSCRKLEQSISADSTGLDNLSLRLDRRIEHFDTFLTQPLAQSLACVARMRNILVTPVHRLPSQILQKIFESAVTGPSSDLRFESAISTNCLCLYRILSVCSGWRKAGIAHAPLWTLVPLVCFQDRPRVITEKAVKLSLERAGLSELRFVADIGDFSLQRPSSFWEVLADNAPRFRFVDIHSSSYDALEGILDPILVDLGSRPGTITELSLCGDLFFRSKHPDPHYLFRPDRYMLQASFEVVLNSLQVLRLKNVLPYMGNASLSNLVELRLHSVRFGPETALKEFLRAVASASRLATLDMVAVMADEETPHTIMHTRSFSLPSLKTLYLDYMPCNAIRAVLTAIKPGSHRTILALSQLSRRTRRQHDEVDSGIHALRAAISSHSLDTLIIEMSWLGGDSGGDLRYLLFAHPTITTIYIRDPDADHDLFVALTRPSIRNFANSTNGFPKLHQIYMCYTSITEIVSHTAFKEMLSSHPVQELVLRRTPSAISGFTAPENWHDIASTDADLDEKTLSLKIWLQEN